MRAAAAQCAGAVCARGSLALGRCQDAPPRSSRAQENAAGATGPARGVRMAEERPTAALRNCMQISQKMRCCLFWGCLTIYQPHKQIFSTTISASSRRFEWHLCLLCKSYFTGLLHVKCVFCVPAVEAGGTPTSDPRDHLESIAFAASELVWPDIRGI